MIERLVAKSCRAAGLAVVAKLNLDLCLRIFSYIEIVAFCSLVDP